MPQQATAPLEFEPFTAGTDADPYPTYKRLREEEPVHHSRRFGFHALSRFDDIQAVSRDWQRFSNAQGVDIDRTGDYFGPNFLESDPPQHRILRGLAQRRFTPKVIRETLEPTIRDWVARVVAELEDRGDVDLGTELAWPLPFAIACQLLGFPPEDGEFLSEASRTFIEREQGEILPPASAQRAAEQLRAYVSDVIEARRRKPGDDLVSMLVDVQIDGEPLTEAELVGNVFLLFDAGTQTTACLLSNAFVLLAAHPDQRKWLAQNLDEIPRAVEEVLRFESPVQHLTRTTTTDVELHGTTIPSGSTVVLLYGAANRDPAIWDEADGFDVRRVPKRNLAFGEGIHHCIGAPIARLEATVALEALVPLMESYELGGDPVRLRSHLLRGYVRVPARFGS